MKIAAIIIALMSTGCKSVEWTVFPEQQRNGIIVVVEGNL